MYLARGKYQALSGDVALGGSVSLCRQALRLLKLHPGEEERLFLAA